MQHNDKKKYIELKNLGSIYFFLEFFYISGIIGKGVYNYVFLTK